MLPCHLSTTTPLWATKITIHNVGLEVVQLQTQTGVHRVRAVSQCALLGGAELPKYWPFCAGHDATKEICPGGKKVNYKVPYLRIFNEGTLKNKTTYSSQRSFFTQDI